VLIAVTMKFKCWVTPTAKRIDVAVTGKTSKASLWDYVEYFKDVRVVLMDFQYSACFGTEPVMSAP
jgi:hypothetical protein